MKQGIHPDYKAATITCTTCGNTFESGSIKEEIRVDTCSNCHPFYTGEQKFGKAAGRVETFNRRYGRNKDKEENPKDFNFISSGDIADGESLIVSTMRLLDILSKDDIKDGLEGGDIERSGENIEHILLHEHTGKNIGYISFKKQKDSQEWKNQFLEKCMYTLLKIWDNNITKKILWYIYFLKDRLIHQSQNTRKVLYGMWAWISVILLYFIVSSFFHFAANTPDIEAAKTQFALAQSHISKAGENMNDPDMFSHYIDLASEIVKELQQEELFLHDVEKLQDTMGVLQKQFNGIEPFEVTSENTLYSFDTPHKVVKILSISNKVYAVYERGISWPIIQWETAEDFIFEELSESDYFIDATVYDTNIILITHEGKIVNFACQKLCRHLNRSDLRIWVSRFDLQLISTLQSFATRYVTGLLCRLMDWG